MNERPLTIIPQKKALSEVSNLGEVTRVDKRKAASGLLPPRRRLPGLPNLAVARNPISLPHQEQISASSDILYASQVFRMIGSNEWIGSTAIPSVPGNRNGSSRLVEPESFSAFDQKLTRKWSYKFVGFRRKPKKIYTVPAQVGNGRFFSIKTTTY